MMGAAGATVSVVTTSASEAGPSRFLVKARSTMRYFVKGAEEEKGGKKKTVKPRTLMCSTT